MTKSIYDTSAPVGLNHRVLGFGDLFSLWFSLGIGLAVLQSGALLAPGLGMSGSLLAIITGAGAGAILLALAGSIGASTGLSAMSGLSMFLGRHGAASVAIINLIQLVGWGAFELVVMRDAASLLSARVWGNDSWLANPVLWTLLFGVLATWLAISGPLSFVRLILRRWGIWLLLFACFWLTWHLLTTTNLHQLWNSHGDGSLSFAVGCDITIAMGLSWLPLIADYTRFSKPGARSFAGTTGGFFLGSLWMMALGAAYTLAYPNSAESQALLLALAGTAVGIPLLLVLIDETENAFADIHSAAVSGGFLMPLRVEILALCIGVLATLIAWLVPLSQYENFLLLIGSVFAPLFSVVLTCWFLLRYRDELSDGQQRLALICWVIGVIVYHFVSYQFPTWGATLPAMVVSAVCMLAGSLLVTTKKTVHH